MTITSSQRLELKILKHSETCILIGNGYKHLLLCFIASKLTQSIIDINSALQFATAIIHKKQKKPNSLINDTKK